MQLLVSVRSAEEARAALAGGAGIIDAKEPEAGALGAVSPEVLAGIRASVPRDIALSAALGDVTSQEDVATAFAGLTGSLSFAKLGFQGVNQAHEVERLLGAAVKLAAGLTGKPGVVAVAYADWNRVGSLQPDAFPEIVRRAGAHGLLIDTAIKEQGRLPDFLAAEELGALGRTLKQHSLCFAMAGSLGISDVALALTAGADIFGLRGAVSIGGRNGRIDRRLVSDFASLVTRRAEPSSRSSPALPPAAQSLRQPAPTTGHPRARSG